MKKNRVPPKMSPLKQRITIKIPKNSKIAEYLGETSSQPHWKSLENLLYKKDNYDIAEMNLDMLIQILTVLFPNKAEKLKKIKPLILWGIIEDQEMTMKYLESLCRISKE